MNIHKWAWVPNIESGKGTRSIQIQHQKLGSLRIFYKTAAANAVKFNRL